MLYNIMLAIIVYGLATIFSLAISFALKDAIPTSFFINLIIGWIATTIFIIEKR